MNYLGFKMAEDIDENKNDINDEGSDAENPENIIF